jgi:FKBP-type peptidyl-prolyl cis-trans isomerase FkpA
MIKWLLSILLICFIVAGCTKSDSGVAQYKLQAAIDDKIVTDYLASSGLSEKFKRTSDTSGVYYMILQQGVGSDLYSSSTQVTVGDTGRVLGSQKIFYQTDSFHPSYILGQVILGWQLGIPQVKKGGVIRLLIPSRYAYGPYPQDSIGLPANAVLDFHIKVYDIKN